MKYSNHIIWRSAALVVGVAVLLPAIAAAQGKWWQSERFQRGLNLTVDQIARIEEVFQATVPDLRQQKKALDRAEDNLERLIDGATDETTVMQEVDRVEALRAELSKARTRMLLRMRRLLTAEQRVKL